MPRTTIRSDDITDAQVKTVDMAVDPTNASNLSSGSVPLAQLGNAPATDVTGIEADLALLAFKTQANGNLARYNLVDQSVDAFEDASGVDTSTSTGEYRDTTGKYYSGSTPSASVIVAKTTVETSTWTSPSDITGVMEILVVAGGGGSGHNQGGGGGAGGVLHHAAFPSVASQAYGYTVGGGGAGGTSSGTGANGGNSVFDSAGVNATITALGGGGGQGQSSAISTGAGSGGGGTSGQDVPSVAGTGDQADSGGATGYGNAGGTGSTPGAPYSWGSCGGGGGADAVGGNGIESTTGIGGAGKLFSTFVANGTDSSNVASTGSNGGYFGGGGGGGDNAVPSGAGGVGGGGTDGSTGLANTGGGGGGGYWSASAGVGGTGVVLIAYDTGVFNNMILVSNSTTAEAAPTKGDLVFTYTNGTGTAVLGTNITAEYSADNGSTWTDFGIGASDSQGTTGGHTIVTKNNVTLTTTSGTSMRYRIKTLVQSVSLQTRIHAVSLGWS